MGELYQNNVSVYYGMWENGEKAPHLNRARGVYDRTLKKDKELLRPMSQTQPRTNIRDLSEGFINPQTDRKKTEVTPDWRHQQHGKSQDALSNKRNASSQVNLHNRSANINEPFHFPKPPSNRHLNNHKPTRNSQSSRRLISSRGKDHDEDTKSTTGKSRCGHKNCIPNRDWLQQKKRK